MKDLSNFLPKKIIVKMPNCLGDLIMAIPLLTLLRKRFPKAHITAMCASSGAALEGNPDVDNIYAYPRWKGSLIKKWGLFKERIAFLKNGQFDLAISLHAADFCSHAVHFFLAGVKVRLGHSYLNFPSIVKSFFLTHRRLEKKWVMHNIRRHQELLLPFGVKVFDEVPEIFVTQQEEMRALEMVRRIGCPLGAKIIAVNPKGAMGNAVARHWDMERFVLLAQKIVAEDPSAFVVFIGEPRNRQVIEQELGPQKGGRIISLAGQTTLREIFALIKISNALITIDTGAMHIGVALKKPLVAIIGSASLVETSPYRVGSVVTSQVGCLSCALHTCPIDHRCMKRVSVDMVYRAFQEEMAKEKANR